MTIEERIACLTEQVMALHHELNQLSASAGSDPAVPIEALQDLRFAMDHLRQFIWVKEIAVNVPGLRAAAPSLSSSEVA